MQRTNANVIARNINILILFLSKMFYFVNPLNPLKQLSGTEYAQNVQGGHELRGTSERQQLVGDFFNSDYSLLGTKLQFLFCLFTCSSLVSLWSSEVLVVVTIEQDHRRQNIFTL